MLKNKWISALIIIIVMVITGYISIAGLSIIDARYKTQEVEGKFNEEIFEKIVKKSYSLEKLFTLLELKASKLNSENTGSEKITLTAKDKEVMRNLEHVYWYYTYPKYSYVFFLTIMPLIPLLFLVAGSNGILGSIIKLFYDSTWNNSPISNSKYLTIMVLGFGIGVAVFGLLFMIIPSSLGYGIMGILLLCLFGGWFSKKFRDWIESKLPAAGSQSTTGN